MTAPDVGQDLVPGEVIVGDGEVTYLPDRAVRRLRVTNRGDRPIQVGSHFHLAEANPALDLDRVAARGCRLAIAAGTSERFEPGLARDVEVVAFGGARVAAGFRGEVAGPLDPAPVSHGSDAPADPGADPAPNEEQHRD